MSDERPTDLMKDPPVAALLSRLGARLILGQGDQQRSLLVKGRTLLGSSPEADVVIGEPTVSRVHCVLEPRDDGIWARDLGSRNGTYVDQMRIKEVRLRDNATLLLGGARLWLRYEHEPSAAELWPTDRFGEAVGASLQMRELFAVVARMATATGAVLIQGETGTGKEVLARSLHLASPRSEAPFVVFDCAAVPESLIESELVDWWRGWRAAPGGRGAARRRPGARPRRRAAQWRDAAS
jgi:hypothetical protein